MRKIAKVLTIVILVSACSGSSKNSGGELMVTTTFELTTTTVDPNLDPFYPELGDAFGIGTELAAQYGPDVAAYCLLFNDLQSLPDSATYRDIEAIGSRLEDGIYEGSSNLSSLTPYMEGLFAIAEFWKDFYHPKRILAMPYSVSTEEMARKELISAQMVGSPSCYDTKFLEWLDYKGFTEKGKQILGTK